MSPEQFADPIATPDHDQTCVSPQRTRQQKSASVHARTPPGPTSD